MRAFVEDIHVAPDVERYIVALVAKTRSHPKIAVGSSPRGSLALLKVTRAWAAIQGRTFVTPDDVKHFARAALAHRLILQPSLWGSRTTEGEIITEILETIPVPVLPTEHE